MEFAICYNNNIEQAAGVKDVLSGLLPDAQILDIDNLQTGSDFARGSRCSPELACEQQDKQGEHNFAFVIGGDGTILKAARFFAPHNVPIFGINLGNLGFLSQAGVNEIEVAVQKILDGQFKTQERIMLKSGTNTALNDFVIKGCAQGRTSRFSLKINGELLCDYLADGIIIATPTGSTAYGLSAGGPVLEPSLNAFVIVPIAAHTLSARPLVVPDSEKITVCTQNFVVSADGQDIYEGAGEIIIEKSPYSATLALLNDTEPYPFYPLLRNKLHWGVSPA